jgi:hypothetical protein
VLPLTLCPREVVSLVARSAGAVLLVVTPLANPAPHLISVLLGVLSTVSAKESVNGWRACWVVVSAHYPCAFSPVVKL